MFVPLAARWAQRVQHGWSPSLLGTLQQAEAPAVGPCEMKGLRESGRRYGLSRVKRPGRDAVPWCSRTAGAAGLSPAAMTRSRRPVDKSPASFRYDKVKFGARVADSRAPGSSLPLGSDGLKGGGCSFGR